MAAMDVFGLLIRHEGERFKCYPDPSGVGLCIGVGRNMTTDGFYPNEVPYFTAKYGDDWRHHIKNEGIDQADSRFMLGNDVAFVSGKLAEYDWFRSLDEARRAALIDMAFEMGMGGAGTAHGLLGFHDMIKAIVAKDFGLAKVHGLRSTWGFDPKTKKRADEVTTMIETGKWPEA